MTRSGSPTWRSRSPRRPPRQEHAPRRGTASASAQPGQFPAYAGPVGGRRALVADHAARAACQDQRQDRAPWALRRLPVGRGGDSPSPCSPRSCVGSIGSDRTAPGISIESKERNGNATGEVRPRSTEAPSKVTRTPLTRPEMGSVDGARPFRCQLWMPRALLSRSESPDLGLQRPAYGGYRVRNSHGRIEPEAVWVSRHTAHVDTDIRPVGVWDIDRDTRTPVEDPRIARLIYDPDDISRQRQVPASEHARARYREPLSRVRKGEPYVS